VLRGEGQGSKSFDKQKDFVLAIQAAHVLQKNYRYDYFIFTRKK
jgi:hypothetical protein